MSTVSIVKCSDYEQAKMDGAVQEAIDLLGGIGQYVRPGDRVLLKINLLAGTAPEKAVTTHPPGRGAGHDRPGASDRRRGDPPGG